MRWNNWAHERLAKGQSVYVEMTFKRPKFLTVLDSASKPD